MRVLQVNATYATGSTGEIVCGIAHAGHKRGVETYFASSVLQKHQVTTQCML